MAEQRYAVPLHVEPPYGRRVPRQALTALAGRVLATESVAPPAELSVVIAGDETVRELNRRYRGVNETTDVLSFGLETADRFVTPDGMRRLGEIVISLPTALRQAETAGHSLRAELEHLLVHGILHVLGYDHESPRSEKAMRAREEELLGWPVH